MLGEQLKIGDDVEKGKERLMELVESVLKYSVNTWDQGFMVCFLSALTFSGGVVGARFEYEVEIEFDLPILSFDTGSRSISR